MPTDNDGSDIRSLLEGAMAADQGGGNATESSGVSNGGSGGDVSRADESVSLEGEAGESSVALGSKDVDGPSNGMRARDSSGKFSKAEKSATEAPRSGKAPSSTQAPVAGKPAGTAPPVAAEPDVTEEPAAPETSQTRGLAKALAELRPPQGWRPAAREEWAKIPREVQKEIVKREWDMNAGNSQAMENRAFRDQFQEVVSPYMGMIQAEGGEPLKAVSELLRTAAALRTAPPQHKAQLVAGLIKSYGIPIDALDSILAGEAPAQQAQQQQHVDPAQIAKQVEERIFAGLQQRQTQQAAAKLQAEVQAFASDPQNKFFSDVREDMADIWERAKRGGRVISLKAAYDRACRENDDVRPLIEQSAAAKAATSANEATQRARAAASTVRNQPATPVAGGRAKDVRGAIEAAIALHSGHS